MKAESKIYKYIIDNTVRYFNTNRIKGSQRYLLSLSNELQLELLEKELKINLNITTINIKDDRLKNDYVTYFDASNKLVFAIAIREKTNNDFLATLRNIIGQGEYIDYSIVMIFNGELDTVMRGTKSLEDNHMPLNVNYVLNKLKDEFKTCLNSEKDLIIINILLDNSLKDFYDVNQTIFDIEIYLDIIKKGKIEKTDYEAFGLFPYECPDGIDRKRISLDLADNSLKFSKIQQYHNIGNLKKLNLEYTDSVRKKLKNIEEWTQIPYSSIKQSNDNMKQKAKIEYISSAGETMTTLTNEKLTLLDIPESPKGAGLRTRNIIIFNNQAIYSHKFILKFNKPIRKNNVEKGSKYVTTFQKNLLVTIESQFSEKTIEIIYKHEGKNFRFKIVILPLELGYFNQLELNNLSISTRQDHKKIIRFEYTTNKDAIQLGYENQTSKVVQANNYLIKISNENRYKINLENEEIDTSCLLKYDSNDISFELNINIDVKDKKISINSKDIISKKIENKISFRPGSQSSMKLGFSNYEANDADLLMMIKAENEMLEKSSYSLELRGTDYHDLSENIDVPTEINDAYRNLINNIKKRDTVLLLEYWDEELRGEINSYLEIVFRYIESISERVGESDSLNILKLGSIKTEDEIYFTSLNVLNLLYYSELSELYGGCKFPRRFTDLLNCDNQLPFLYDLDEEVVFYNREENHKYTGWAVYKKDELNYSKESKHIRRIVKEKLGQYTSHFSYIFTTKVNPFFKINAISINDTDNFILGLMDFLKTYFKPGKAVNIPKVEIYCKRAKASSSNILDFMNNTNDLNVVSNKYGFDFAVSEFDSKDVYRTLLDVMKLYYIDDISSLPLSHITFLELSDKPSDESYGVFGNSNSFYLNGLISSVGLTQRNKVTNYSIGMNKEKILRSCFLQKICMLNEYSYRLKSKNLSNVQSNSVTSIVYSSIEDYEKIIGKSDWLTIISPTMTPNYYVNQNRSTIVLHYNDRYTNGSSYDAITLSNESDKYKNVLKNAFKSQSIYNSETLDESKVISAFNAINGEWLLKIIDANENDVKEKLSLVATMKILLNTFNSKNMLWVPISMEEILRVSGALRITGNDGLFNVDALDLNGSRSDDLMLVGFIKTEIGINVSFIPVEVKAGKNKSDVFKKAIRQLENTTETLNEYLYDNDRLNKLRKDVLGNFFIQIALTNYSKLVDFNVIEEDTIFSDIKRAVELDEYSICNLNFFGNGILFSMSENVGTTTLGEFDTIYKIEMSSSTISRILNTSVKDIDVGFKFTKEDFNIFDKTAELENTVVNTASLPQNTSQLYENELESHLRYDKLSNLDSNVLIASDSLEAEYSSELNNNSIIDKKNSILIGSNDTYSDVYWEFDDKRLQNRHLLITGSSGSGKTYAIQTLMYEVQKSNVPIVIFDYTEGFRPNQLDPDFIKKTKDRIKEHIVIIDKIGINPFTQYPIDLGDGLVIYEETHQVANRISESFKNVYKFGDQQFSALYECIRDGLNYYGDEFNFSLLNNELEKSKNKAAQSVKSKILPFMDADLFRSDNKLDWRDIHNNGDIHIIQMTRNTREIQMLLTEIILWDFWNYIKANGSVDKPVIIVLDEAQNINHSEKSPSGYILTEGRKFGVSGWYATQFLKNSIKNDEIERLQQAAQKLFFRPTESGISEIANYLTSDKKQSDDWKKKLAKLSKGECVSVGSGLDMTQLIQYNPKVVKIKSFKERLEDS